MTKFEDITSKETFPTKSETKQNNSTKVQETRTDTRNKHQRKWRSKMDNPEKLATQGTQNEENQNKYTICVGHHYTQANTNNVNKT